MTYFTKVVVASHFVEFGEYNSEVEEFITKDEYYGILGLSEGSVVNNNPKIVLSYKDKIIQLLSGYLQSNTGLYVKINSNPVILGDIILGELKPTATHKELVSKIEQFGLTNLDNFAPIQVEVSVPEPYIAGDTLFLEKKLTKSQMSNYLRTALESCVTLSVLTGNNSYFQVVKNVSTQIVLDVKKTIQVYKYINKNFKNIREAFNTMGIDFYHCWETVKLLKYLVIPDVENTYIFINKSSKTAKDYIIIESPIEEFLKQRNLEDLKID